VGVLEFEQQLPPAMVQELLNRHGPGNFLGKQFQSELSSNEVFCTSALLLLIKIMLCSKLQCQKVFELKLFSYKIQGSGADSQGWRFGFGYWVVGVPSAMLGKERRVLILVWILFTPLV
jgi:hypothetical protein